MNNIEFLVRAKEQVISPVVYYGGSSYKILNTNFIILTMCVLLSTLTMSSFSCYNSADLLVILRGPF